MVHLKMWYNLSPPPPPPLCLHRKSDKFYYMFIVGYIYIYVCRIAMYIAGIHPPQYSLRFHFKKKHFFYWVSSVLVNWILWMETFFIGSTEFKPQLRVILANYLNSTRRRRRSVKFSTTAFPYSLGKNGLSTMLRYQ